MKRIQQIAGRVRKHRESVRGSNDDTLKGSTRTLANGAIVSIRSGEIVAVITITNKQGRKATTTCAPSEVDKTLARFVKRLGNWF